MILMLNNIDNLNNTVKDAFKEHGLDCDTTFLYSRYPELSDIQCNELLKNQKIVSLHQLVNLVQRKLNDLEEVKECVIKDDLFINVSLSDEFLAKQLVNNPEWAKAFDDSLKNSSKRNILFDYGGPNIGKALHVGHLRSLSIGRSLYRMNELVGNSVTSDIHLGDWGMPVAYMIALIEKDELLLENMNYEDIEEIYPEAVAYAENNQGFYEVAKNISFELNRGNQKYIKIWEDILSISTKYIRRTLTKLGHSFDEWKGESDVNKLINPMIVDLLKQEKIIKNEGALVANIDIEPPIIITKSDGSSLYITTDLATVTEREESNFDEVVYVVDNRQKKHFEQLFRCIEYFNLSKSDFKHVGFGTINGRDGKPLKTRDGGVYKLDELYKDIEKELVSRKTPKDSVGTLVNDILTFSDLLTNRNTDYKFDIEKFTDTNGKTAIYIEYAYVRGSKVLKDAKTMDWDESTKIVEFEIMNTTERELVIEILKFKSYLDLSILNNEPHHLADYVYTIAKKLNAFYENEKILNLEYEKATQKLFLLRYTLHVLFKGMYALGINPVEKL